MEVEYISEANNNNMIEDEDDWEADFTPISITNPIKVKYTSKPEILKFIR